MHSAFASLAFVEPARAEANLKLIAARLPEPLFAALPTLLAQLPDPDGALNYLERYLRPENAGGNPRVLNYLAQHPAALHYILVIFSFSRFLSETLIQQPELAIWLHRPSPRYGLERVKSPEDLQEEFARFEASGFGESPSFGTTSFDQPPAVILARFKRREYLRIVLRDVLGIATLADTTLELSRLADVLLDRALRICQQKLGNAYGAPRFTDSAGRVQPAHIAVLSLGKLGAQELNYSSDIDLMFLYDRDGETAGGTSGAISNAEFFVRLAQAILKLVAEPTPEGAVFRVDLRLRPQGSEGDVAISLPSALEYYRRSAREWELQMLIKARGSAGDPETARRFLREVQPFIYRPEFNLAAVAAVLNAREEITRQLRAPKGVRPAGHAAQWNVKLSPGGIRDIEFLTQCLQRLYGGADPWLATPSTLVGLQRLHDKGHLTGTDFAGLGAAYEFLRRVEHRLQLRDGLQRHTLPEAPDALDRLARRCGLETVGRRHPRDGLLARISEHFREVEEIYARIVRPQPGERAEVREHAAGREPGESALARRLRREFPGVAQTTSEISAGSDAYARRGLERFLSSALLDGAVMRQLEAHPRWLLQAAELFSRSDLVVDMLARHPDEIAALADPGLAGFRGPLSAQDDLQEGMAALRVGYRRSQLATIVRALLSHSVGAAEPFATLETLSRLAEEAIAGAMHLAAREVLGDVDWTHAPFAVMALGRLGTREMDIGSDADLVFVIDDSIPSEQRESWRRLAERFVHVVSSHTREGLLFPVDTRLRPGGTEGEIVQTVGHFREYFREQAQGWEAATYLKARPVGGNLALAEKAIAAIHAELKSRFAGSPEAGAQLARQLAYTRQRLEKEGSGARAKGEFKKFSGGFYDVDYVAAFLSITQMPEIPAPGHVVRQIALLEAAKALEPAAARTLRSATVLYRGLDHALRLVTGRTANHLPEPALAGRITVLLHQWGMATDGDLESAIAKVRQHTRSVYETVLGAAASHPAG